MVLREFSIYRDRELEEKLLQRINVNALLCFNKAIARKSFEAYIFEAGANRGVYFLDRSADDLYIAHISFLTDDISVKHLAHIDKLIKKSITTARGKKLFIHVNAYNDKIISLVHQHGFQEKPDSPGYEYLYILHGNEQRIDNLHNIEYRDYQPHLIDDYLYLLDQSFKELNRKN